MTPTPNRPTAPSPHEDRLRGTVLQQLSRLTHMNVAALREKWRELYGHEAPVYNRHYLLRRLAYRIQEMYYGGLSDATKSQLERLAATDPFANLIQGKPQPKPTDTRLVPGARLRRRWRGVEYEVVVVPGGFQYDGQIHRSLSAVATAITGAKWNGRVFFGAKPRR